MDAPSDILVVDDTPANLRLLSQMLAERGYKVRAVLNGSHAITAAQAALPDLILLDIRMPDMDGYQVCQYLKADERTRHVPVLFISALGETEDKVKAFAVGGVDYITKPFQVEEVLARVQTHLTLRNLHRQLQTANAELAQQLAELEVRNEELDAFAHTVAHDIKNPVGQVIGYAGFLEQYGETVSAEERGKALRALVRIGRKINNILDELLLLAGVRKTEAQLAPLDMGRIVTEAQQRLTYLIKEYQAEIVLPAAWPTALGYAPWIEEVWANYLSNGCKYGGTPSAAPRLELGGALLPSPQAGEGQGGSMVRFWVRDNGDGLASEQQSRLFTPFTRLDQVRARGHGLGLSIVRRIVEKLGGQVGVESDGAPGQGSTFYFTLPAAPRV
jgi:two-component system sensor histidine kinase/response regulator